MRIRYVKDIKCDNCSNPFPTGYDKRCHIGLPGFIQYLQHIYCFRGYFLYMDIAPRMERQFRIDINKLNSRFIRGDNFSYSD